MSTHIRKPLDDHDGNRPLGDGAKLLNGVATAGAVLDRFLHHATTIAITGRSYRIKDSLPAAPENKKNRKPNEPLAALGRELRARCTSPARFTLLAKPAPSHFIFFSSIGTDRPRCLRSKNLAPKPTDADS